MVQCRSRFSFLQKSWALRLVHREMLRQELQVDDAVEPGVVSFVDDAHSTLAELLKNLVVRYGLPNHRTHLPLPLRSSGIRKVAITLPTGRDRGQLWDIPPSPNFSFSIFPLSQWANDSLRQSESPSNRSKIRSLTLKVCIKPKRFNKLAIYSDI